MAISLIREDDEVLRSCFDREYKGGRFENVK